MIRRPRPVPHVPEFGVLVDRSTDTERPTTFLWRCGCFGVDGWREAPTAAEASAAHRRHKEEVMAR